MGALSNIGGRGPRNRKEIEAGTVFIFLAASPLSSASDKTAMLRMLQVVIEENFPFALICSLCLGNFEPISYINHLQSACIVVSSCLSPLLCHTYNIKRTISNLFLELFLGAVIGMTTYRLYVKQLDISCWCEKKIIKMKKLDYKCQMGTDPYIKSVSKKKTMTSYIH